MASHLIEAQPRSTTLQGSQARVPKRCSPICLPLAFVELRLQQRQGALRVFFVPSNQIGIFHVRSEHKRSQRGRGSDTTKSEKLGPLCGSTPRRRASACTIGFSSTLQNRRRQDQTRGQNHENTDRSVRRGLLSLLHHVRQDRLRSLTPTPPDHTRTSKQHKDERLLFTPSDSSDRRDPKF